MSERFDGDVIEYWAAVLATQLNTPGARLRDYSEVQVGLISRYEQPQIRNRLTARLRDHGVTVNSLLIVELSNGSGSLLMLAGNRGAAADG